jgi:hypothetical protein
MDPGSIPPVKLEAWKELLKTRAPGPSLAKAAAAALAIGWSNPTTNVHFQTNLRELRKGALDVIIIHGVADASVYADLERSYNNNFRSNRPDNDEVIKALNALGAVGSDESVALLFSFLQELNARRRSGPWANKERQFFEWVVACIGVTRTQSQEVRLLLTQIARDSRYTPAERGMVTRAMTRLGFS